MVLAVIAVIAVLTVAGTAASSRSRRSHGSAGGRAPRALGAARTVAVWRFVGLLGGVAAAAWSVQDDGLGRGVMLSAPLVGLGVLTGVVIGELLVTAPRGPVREAGLAVRSWRAYPPPLLVRAVSVGTVLLAGILVAGTLSGSPDDLGRAGRSLVRQCSAVMTQGHGPWPGSFYAGPSAVVVGGGLLLAGIALVRIARRPSQGEDPAIEDGLRRRSAAAVTAAAGLLVAVPLAGVSAVAAMALLGIDCAPVWWTVLGWALVAVVPLAVGLAARCLVVLVAPAVAAAPPVGATTR